jgi:uncharacterized protein (TIGR00369 family)
MATMLGTRDRAGFFDPDRLLPSSRAVPFRRDAFCHHAAVTEVAGDPDRTETDARIRASFAKQGLMRTIGATLESIAPGAVEISMRPHDAISQQHGFVHAAAVCAIADSAAGYASLTLMPPGTGVLSTEFKINLLAPATGDQIVARGRVVKAGRTLTVAQSEVVAETDGVERLIALLTATMMAVEDREGIID